MGGGGIVWYGIVWYSNLADGLAVGEGGGGRVVRVGFWELGFRDWEVDRGRSEEGEGVTRDTCPVPRDR